MPKIELLVHLEPQGIQLAPEPGKIPPEALALSEIYNLSVMEPDTNGPNHRLTLSDSKHRWELGTWFLLLAWLKRRSLYTFLGGNLTTLYGSGGESFWQRNESFLSLA